MNIVPTVNTIEVIILTLFQSAYFTCAPGRKTNPISETIKAHTFHVHTYVY